MATKGYRFKGHETFYFREGWLSKALIGLDENPEVNFLVNISDGIAKLGVGSNMVKSIKYWLLVTGLINRQSQLSPLGRIIAENDPYLENEFTLWLLHLNLVNNLSQATTWQIFWNRFKADNFKYEDVIKVIISILESEEIQYNVNSLQNDISVLLSMYSKTAIDDDPEENMICPLSRLNLIKQTQNIYSKELPVMIEGIELIVLYLITNFAEKETNDRDYLKLVDIEKMLSNQMNMNRIMTSDILDMLKGRYVDVVKTAGLDIVYLNQVDILNEIREYYLVVNGRV